MSDYKIGNKVTGIIRAYTSGEIGSVTMTYNNQPYTIIKAADASATFTDIDTKPRSTFTDLVYNNSKLSTIEISDVVLNDKILNLIFNKSEEKLISRVENIDSSDGILYLSIPNDEIYQVFIYNAAQELVNAFGTLTKDQYAIAVPEDGNYIVCYQYEGEIAYSLDRAPNQYYTLDLIITSNINNTTQTMNLHVHKCGLKINKNLYFDQRSNSVDLTFTVIDTGKDYITVK